MNYDDRSIQFEAIVRFDIPGGERFTRTRTELVPAGETFRMRVADLLPESQANTIDANAGVTLRCDGGKMPCPATIANWYGAGFDASVPRTTYFAQSVCPSSAPLP